MASSLEFLKVVGNPFRELVHVECVFNDLTDNIEALLVADAADCPAESSEKVDEKHPSGSLVSIIEWMGL